MHWSASVRFRVIVIFGSVVATAEPFTAARVLAAPAGTVEFERDVQPIFSRYCYECHGAKKQKGGLRLDVRGEALRGGDSGAVVRPGKSTESDLIHRVAGLDPDDVMPPKGEPLSAEQIGILRAWIDQGANWPETDGVVARVDSDHWAFQAPRRSPVPPVKNQSWVRNAIDSFVLARLETEGIKPAPEANRRTLIRRLSLDLLGLAPTPAEVDAFVQDPRPDAYARLVDRLLASPHFGERWGKHWLDLARYADTDGYTGEKERPFAWRFRSWTIDAINHDLPFDRFTIEQLAGDLLPEANLDTKIATGFHRNTLTNRETGTDPEEFRVRNVVDRVNTTATAWLGLTMGCAECHSHKYDPITQREYYGLYAFFNNLQEVDLAAPLPDEMAAYEQALRAFEAGALKAKPKPPAGKALVIQASSTARPTRVHIRGDFLQTGDEVAPHTPAVLPPLPPESHRPTRLDLAKWLVDPAHPLTARVAVNHFWQHLFGHGLVRTEEDFGTQGEPPTHPELLDWLATEFIAQGWSRKAMIRQIVTSATYRQSSAPRQDGRGRDPENRLLARQNRLRVEAEIVRDLALQASGRLDARIGGPSFRPPVAPGLGEVVEFVWSNKPTPDQYRRGLYILVQRTIPFPQLMAFDAPDASVPCTRRVQSNTPLQALTLMNDPDFVEYAKSLGRRLLAEKAGPRSRIEQAFKLCFGRLPDAKETARLLELLNEQRELYRAEPALVSSLTANFELPEQTDALEFAAWTGVARVLLNLDEFITRQ